MFNFPTEMKAQHENSIYFMEHLNCSVSLTPNPLVTNMHKRKRPRFLKFGVYMLEPVKYFQIYKTSTNTASKLDPTICEE